MKASYFVRSTPEFGRRDRNKVGVITKGTKFNVLRSIQMSGGAEALQIHVTGLSGNAHLQTSKSYWIYKSKDSDFKKLDNSPRETQAGTTETPCEGCGNVQPPTSNQRDIGDVSTTIIRQDNQPGEDDSEAEDSYTPRSPGSLDQQIRNYSNSSKVENTVKFALRNKKRRSIGRCYRYVKDALAAGKLIPSWYSGVAARTGKDALKRYGFVNLLESEPYKSQIKKPSDAPKGAVLVYSSGVPCKGTNIPDCGHIEIKTGRSGDNAYVSDYSYPTGINETPRAVRYGSRYRLIGVMIKPM